jgi:hypothetical protein
MPDEQMESIEAVARQIVALAMPLMEAYGRAWPALRAIEKATAALKCTCTANGWPPG